MNDRAENLRRYREAVDSLSHVTDREIDEAIGKRRKPMSHTVIPDHRDRMLQLENVSNRLVHHCRIVNVKWKPIKAPNFPKTKWPPAIFGPPIINGDSMIFWPKWPLDNILVGSPSTENGRFVGSATD